MDVDFFKNNASDVLLEVEINPDIAAAFENEYAERTGQTPESGPNYQHQPNKWGGEYRIYFNSEHDLLDEFAALKIDVEQGHRPYRGHLKYRVNNQAFFWALVAAGYRLGEN